MSNHYQVELEQHPIELYKLLKIANVVGGGGEAKIVISNGLVLLNGEIEIQKRKKIYSGDIIQFNGDLIELICHAEPTQKTSRIKKDTTLEPQTRQTNKQSLDFNKTQKPVLNNGQRRKIHFDK